MLNKNLIYPIAMAASLAVTTSAIESGIAASRATAAQIVPAFELMTSDSVLFNWPEKKSPKPLLLWFTNLCGGCQTVLPDLDSLYRHELQTNAELVAVSLLGQDRSTVKSVKEEYGVKFPILIDPEGKLCRAVSGGYIPETCPMKNFYLVGTRGQILFSGHVPGMSWEEIIVLIKANAGSPTADGE